MRTSLAIGALLATAMGCDGNRNGVPTAAAGTAASTSGTVGTSASTAGSTSASASASGTTSGVAASSTSTTSSATSGGTTSGASSGASTGATGSSTSGTTGLSTTGFAIAPHQPLPIVPYEGGPILNPVDIVTISFADVQLDLGAYAEELLASSWFPEVGTEYGVAPGQHLADYVVPDGGPASVSDSDIQAFLAGLIDAGTVPAPTSSTLYAIEYPLETTISLGQGATSCNQIGGYHGFDPDDAAVYAVICNCPAADDLQQGFASAAASDQFYMSHEFMEAATDPATPDSPAYTFSEADLSSLPWLLTVNSEVGDLCVTTPPVTVDAGLIATRIWSNAAADAGVSNPCVPSPPGEVYFTVSPALSDGGLAPTVAQAAANLSQPQTFDFVLTGWSTASIPDWYIEPQLVESSFNPSLSLTNAPQGFASINNGQTQTLSVTVPAMTASQNFAGITIYSTSQTSYYPNVATVAVFVE